MLTLASAKALFPRIVLALIACGMLTTTGCLHRRVHAEYGTSARVARAQGHEGVRPAPPASGSMVDMVP